MGLSSGFDCWILPHLHDAIQIDEESSVQRNLTRAFEPWKDEHRPWVVPGGVLPLASFARQILVIQGSLLIFSPRWIETSPLVANLKRVSSWADVFSGSGSC